MPPPLRHEGVRGRVVNARLTFARQRPRCPSTLRERTIPAPIWYANAKTADALGMQWADRLAEPVGAVPWTACLPVATLATDSVALELDLDEAPASTAG